MGRLSGKVVFVSGAASGPGPLRSWARKKARKGLFGDIADADGHKVEAEIRDAGGEAMYLHLDVH